MRVVAARIEVFSSGVSLPWESMLFRMTLYSIPIVATSVGDSVAELEQRIDTIWAEARSDYGGRLPEPRLEVTDRYVGGGYGVVTDDELAAQVEATRLTGLLFDPTYTGKAITALRREIAGGRWSRGDNVVFWHTGGGFAVFAHDYGDLLA